MYSKSKATLIGLLAIILWGSIVGLIRSVSDGFGPVAGAAMIYSVSALLLLFTAGLPKIGSFPKKYLYFGSALFVLYEICLSLSLGYANTSQQAIEIGMVNYLWPSFTILFAIIFNKQKANLLVIPGLILAVWGVCNVISGENGVNFSQMMTNINDNPLSYLLAFAGAIIWAAYCTITTRIANGKNGITLFFILTAVVLWLQYLFIGMPPMQPDLQSFYYLIMSAIAMAFGYLAWNIGILHGNITILATASYFTPILSVLLAIFILNNPISYSFWQGVIMVCGGSLLCWLSTK